VRPEEGFAGGSPRAGATVELAVSTAAPGCLVGGVPGARDAAAAAALAAPVVLRGTATPPRGEDWGWRAP